MTLYSRDRLRATASPLTEMGNYKFSATGRYAPKTYTGSSDLSKEAAAANDMSHIVDSVSSIDADDESATYKAYGVDSQSQLRKGPRFKFLKHTKRDISYLIGVPFTWTKKGYYYDTNVFFEGNFIGPVLDYINPDFLLRDKFKYSLDERKFPVPDGRTKGLLKLTEMMNDNSLLNEDSFSIMSFLAELKDIRQLTDMVKFHRNHKEVSNKYLGFQFGVAPLVSDIQKIYHLATNLDDKIIQWQEMAAASATRAYHKNVLKETVKGSHSRTARQSNYGAFKWSIVYDYSWTQSVNMKAHIYLTPKKLQGNDLNALKRSVWGVTTPLQTAWNLIPFSFALDWVYPIGDAIAQFEQDDPVLPCNVHDAGLSVSLDTEIKTNVYILVDGVKHFMGESTVSHNRFVRSPVRGPEIMAGIGKVGPLEFTPELSDGQIILSAALAHQMVFK